MDLKEAARITELAAIATELEKRGHADLAARIDRLAVPLVDDGTGFRADVGDHLTVTDPRGKQKKFWVSRVNEQSTGGKVTRFLVIQPV